MTPPEAHARRGLLARLAALVVVLAVLSLSSACTRWQGLISPEPMPPLEALRDPAGEVSVVPSAGLVSHAGDYPWPADAEALRARWSGIDVKQVATPERIVALTLDDGPHDGMMIEATNILERAGARATFFCVGGRVLYNASETRYAFDHGMEIENHTWSHRELDRSKQEDLIQILAADSIIGKVTGVRPLWVRPKSGFADANGAAAVFETGHLLAGWSVHAGDTGDWTARHIEEHVLRTVRPGDIVDLHVTNPRTIEALPGILAGLKAEGFRMVTLSQLVLATQ